jgi:hypothetical protein
MADWKEAFVVINTALGVIAAAGKTPGINLIPYVDLVSSGAAAVQAGLNAAVNVAPYIAAIKNSFDGKLPTDAEKEALRIDIAALEAEVDAALPPPEEGEPD